VSACSGPDIDQRFDVIGSGTLTGHLARWGKRIFIFERGDRLGREAANWDAVTVFDRSRCVSPDT
jgi:hypothetical protein